MTCPCPTCGGTGVVQDADALPDQLDQLRHDCADLGISVSLGGTVTEADFARLIDRSPKTLSNWRHGHQPIRPQRIAGRWRYALTDVAAWLAEN